MLGCAAQISFRAREGQQQQDPGELPGPITKVSRMHLFDEFLPGSALRAELGLSATVFDLRRNQHVRYVPQQRLQIMEVAPRTCSQQPH